MQFGHAVRLRALTAHHYNDVTIQLAIGIGGFYSGFVIENGCWCADPLPVCGNSSDFDDRLAKIPVQHLQPAICGMRV
ncbi:MAG: Uncharacterised protein [SAR116 cluster bacterium]|nr:MAG: Uncharacterised protein [SAR116 cluster bacterium]